MFFDPLFDGQLWTALRKYFPAWVPKTMRILFGVGVVLLIVSVLDSSSTSGSRKTTSIWSTLLFVDFFIVLLLPLVVGFFGWMGYVTHRPKHARGTGWWMRELGDVTQENNGLQMAAWDGVDLRKADLHNANMKAIILESVDLHWVNLRNANLHGANLRNANLRDATLSGADLSAADLSEAVLDGAEIHDARFDEMTILPDGSKWTAEADLSRFGANV